MTVRVNKQPFNLREKLTELERPIGLKGSELMKSETAQEARDLVSAGRKNLVINGDMRVAQRSTTGTKSGNSYGGYLSVDRWAVYYDDTVIAQTDVTINGQPKKACKVTAGSSNGRAYVYHKIENSSRLLGNGTPFSISFWARASRIEQRQINWRFYDHGNQNNGSTSDVTAITIGTEWKHYKIENVSLIDANYNATRDGGLWLFNAVGDDIGTGFWFEFTEVQIEIGKNATEFEYRTYGEELALCQRYFFRSLATRQSILYKGPLWETNWYHFPVEMRANPSLGGGSWFLRNPGSNANISYSGFALNVFRTGFYITSNTTNTNTFQCWFNDAPLTASAEL